MSVPERVVFCFCAAACVVVVQQIAFLVMRCVFWSGADFCTKYTAVVTSFRAEIVLTVLAYAMPLLQRLRALCFLLSYFLFC